MQWPWKTGTGSPRFFTGLFIALAATGSAIQLFYRAQPQTLTPPLEFASDAGQVSSDVFFEQSEYEEPAPTSISISTTLDRSAPVESYLMQAGVERAAARNWGALFRSVAATRNLQKGQPFTIYKDPETGDLRGIKYDLDDRTSVMEAHVGGGVIKATLLPIEYFIRPIRLTFAVSNSFRAAANENGIPKPIIESLVDAFSERNDLDRLAPGSSVKLIYQEKVSRDGAYTLIGDLQAAQIRVGSRTLNAYSFADEHGRSHLYDERGRALGPKSLKYPVNFKYISSGFTFHRYHPLLHIYRPHVGVDLAADYGTPVKAVADGRVESAGWQGELGNCVRLEHQHAMVSIYGHLQKISADLRQNSYVHVGQVIGWVGSTGLSTGPHLHFALEKSGSYVNPLNAKLGENHQVSPRMQGLFNDIKNRYESALASLPDLGSRSAAASSDRIAPIDNAGVNPPRRRSLRISHHRHLSRSNSRGIGDSSATAGGAM